MNEQQLGRALRVLTFAFGAAACGGIAVSKSDRHGAAGSAASDGGMSADGSSVGGTGGGEGGGADEGGASSGSAGVSGTESDAGDGGGLSSGGVSSGGVSSGGAGASGAGGSNADCGNSSIGNGEACDDGNKRAGDGCSDSCTVESGWTCSGTPSACTATHPSCAGLAATCGPAFNADCCASNVVYGGTFLRGYDGATYPLRDFPATVSNFRLDTYEITVGRFRKFVAEYSPRMIAQGSGKNPNNSSDAGWLASWNANLQKDALALRTALACQSPWQTWTDKPGGAANESLPINCIDWYEAEAFCIWDGGRLPTEAEWNYAAAGGAQQRAYPWGSAAPDCTYANFFGAAGGNDFCLAPGTGRLNRVGSESPKGDGESGQADLAGNVWELVQDTHDPYPNPCDNCAASTTLDGRESRGGSFRTDLFYLLSSSRVWNRAEQRFDSWGARCARSAP
jgi:cysteine-rich repeat protein